MLTSLFKLLIEQMLEISPSDLDVIEWRLHAQLGVLNTLTKALQASLIPANGARWKREMDDFQLIR